MYSLKPKAFILPALFLLTVSLGLGAHPAGHIARASTTEAQPAEKPSATAASKTIPTKISELCPQYPGAEVIDVIDGSDSVRAMFKTQDDPAKISAYYKKELTQRGWRLVHEGVEADARLVLRKNGQQIGFGAYRQRNELVTFFLSLIYAKNPSQAPAIEQPLKSPARQ